jgi:hypothetical protein
MRDLFRSNRHALEIRERAPGASPTAAHVLLVLAHFADGHDGTNIRPGNERVAAITGKSLPVIERAIRELLDLGELIRVNGSAHRGSAACYRLNLSKRPSSTTAFSGEKGHRPRRQRPSSTMAHPSDQDAAALADARSAGVRPSTEHYVQAIRLAGSQVAIDEIVGHLRGEYGDDVVGKGDLPAAISAALDEWCEAHT